MIRPQAASPKLSSMEPMVAHGSRMSWAGILRPGNEFAPASKSQLAVMTTESGPPLQRYFGKWDAVFRRFTVNLTSSKIRVVALQPGQRGEGGIMCVLHWVDRRDMVRSDKRSVCHGDGWPTELWEAFTSQLANLPDGSIAEKLQRFLDSDMLDENEAVVLWRKRVKGGVTVPPEERTSIDERWLPVPALLVSTDQPSRCIVSWSPGADFNRSMSDALASRVARLRRPDLTNQAKYYLECTLSRLHGVRFGPDDRVEDSRYENAKEVLEIRESLEKLERQRIADPKLGLLDRFGSE
ncbi:MAG: hypothetical protein JRM88_06950 [Nitrososphaerota archaeon]|nr:hypothetical protein [Nitrososphaerota archaeon]